MNLAERLKWLRKKHGLASKKVAAAAMGIKYGTYQRYEYGATPSRKKFEEIAIYYKCSLSWLMTGEGDPYPNAGGPDTSAFQVIPVQADFPADDFVFIRQRNGSISAGAGLVPDDSTDLLCAFRKDYIKRRGGKPESMSLIHVQGDSMAPTLLDRDLVLVNHGRSSIAPQGGIYAISINDQIMIKRIQPIFPDKLLVISDNKQYPAQEIAAENIRVNGKVIWYARDLER
jgi:phage repressor protein C with HTH and peptisase S24 domain